jgi:1-acyl-sn-glycerol-3-phosphate acyltransferase
VVDRKGRGPVGFWIWFAVVVVKPVVAVLFKRRWRGRENVPPAGGVILVANHLSQADWLTFACYVWDSGRIPRFLAKESLFRVPGVGLALRHTRQIPVRRGTASAGRSLDAAVAELGRGQCVCIYPEGTTTKDPDWWPMTPRTGVARLALATDVPVVPIGQWGPQFLLDVERRRFRPLPRKEAWCVAGEPIDLSAYRGRPLTAELLREVTDLIFGVVKDQVADIRGEAAPAGFYRRPPAREAS